VDDHCNIFQNDHCNIFFTVQVSFKFHYAAKLRSVLCLYRAKYHSRSPTLRVPPRSCPMVSVRKSDCPAFDRNLDSSSRRSKRIRARVAARATIAAVPFSLSETISLRRTRINYSLSKLPKD
jgi:hypothetical protein